MRSYYRDLAAAPMPGANTETADERPWFYLSFCDPDRPKGKQFLGGCYVPAHDAAGAVTFSHLLTCNPGGEVAVVGPIPPAVLKAAVPEADRCRLLRADEINPAREGRLRRLGRKVLALAHRA